MVFTIPRVPYSLMLFVTLIGLGALMIVGLHPGLLCFLVIAFYLGVLRSNLLSPDQVQRPSINPYPLPLKSYIGYACCSKTFTFPL
jgi:hypothetical protein